MLDSSEHSIWMWCPLQWPSTRPHEKTFQQSHINPHQEYFCTTVTAVNLSQHSHIQHNLQPRYLHLLPYHATISIVSHNRFLLGAASLPQRHQIVLVDKCHGTPQTILGSTTGRIQHSELTAQLSGISSAGISNSGGLTPSLLPTLYRTTYSFGWGATSSMAINSFSAMTN